jgi:hypothetical protein
MASCINTNALKHLVSEVFKETSATVETVRVLRLTNESYKYKKLCYTYVFCISLTEFDRNSLGQH